MPHVVRCYATYVPRARNDSMHASGYWHSIKLYMFELTSVEHSRHDRLENILALRNRGHVQLLNAMSDMNLATGLFAKKNPNNLVSNFVIFLRRKKSQLMPLFKDNIVTTQTLLSDGLTKAHRIVHALSSNRSHNFIKCSLTIKSQNCSLHTIN